MTRTSPTGLSWNTATGVISGTPQAATSPGSVTISATNTTGTGNVATLNLNTVAAAVTYSDWQSRYGLNSGSPDTEYGDNTPNQIKYLCDIAPNATMTNAEQAGLPVVGTMTSLGQQYLTITYNQYAACMGMAVVPETSNDMVHWSTATNATTTQIKTLADGDPVMQVRVPLAAASKMFVRLNVTPQ